LLLKLADRLLQLRDGGADVGQLDDVGLGPTRQGSQLGERVAELLLGLEKVGELGDDPSRQ
jgi:hypothetical protein